MNSNSNDGATAHQPTTNINNEYDKSKSKTKGELGNSNVGYQDLAACALSLKDSHRQHASPKDASPKVVSVAEVAKTII